MAVTARQRFGARPFRRNEGPPKRARRGDTVDSPPKIRLGTGGGNLTRFGCPSLKTKTLDCTRRPEHAAQHRRIVGESPGGRAKCGMSHRIRHKRIPFTRPWRAENQGFRYGESRRGVQSRRFAKPKPSLGLCPDDERRATYVGLRYLETFMREVRRQRAGRAGQRSSSESNSSRGGLVGFPTGNASRRNVSRKAGEAE
jgi:hypothetical protein